MSKKPPPYPTSFAPQVWSTHPLLRQSLGYPAVPTKTARPLIFWTPHWPGAVCPVFLFHRIQITVKRNIHWYTLNNTMAFATLTPPLKASIKESLRLYLKYYCEKLMQESKVPSMWFLWKTEFPFRPTASKVKYQRPLSTARAQVWTPCKCLVNHCRD